MPPTLGPLVREKWASLIADHRLLIEQEDEWQVTLRSESVGIAVVRDRGELSVTVHLLTNPEPLARWRYDGMVGKASEARLLEIAAERLLEDRRVLEGDPRLFDQLAEENQQLSREWTDYYAGRGPHPRTGHLP